MKLLDLNLLLYAVDESAAPHDRALPWVEDLLSGTEEVAFSWTVLLGFIRLATNSAVFGQPLDADEALDYVDGWLAQPVTRVVEPTVRHPEQLRELLGRLGTAGNLTSDAHLAALAIEHGAELCSADADFSRFPGLRWSNPLA